MRRPQLPSLKPTVNKLEDAIITLAGPALAISGIIAGVDLLTGGNLMKNTGWMSLAWAICLLLTLDFQVLALGARAHHIYLSKKPAWRKAFEIALAVLIAASISFVSIQMQSIIARANSIANLSIEKATTELGINPIALIWERSALVLVLIFMSGWFREEEAHASTAQQANVPVPAPPPASSSISEETMQVILTKISKLDQLEQLLAAGSVQVSESIDPQPALPAPTGDKDEQGVDTQGNAWEHERKTASMNSPQQGVYGKQNTDFGDTIEAILAAHPGEQLTVREVAALAGCSTRTADKWMKRLQPPAQGKTTHEGIHERTL
jgi:hypothetical protein